MPPSLPVSLRDVMDSDLPIFFEMRRDPEASHMVGFTAANPHDQDAFMARWAKNRADTANIQKTILYDGQVVGNVIGFPWEGNYAVGYWLDKSVWGQGIATQALTQFLQIVTQRPLHAMVVHDNIGSLRVLQKCGFVITGEGRAFANARGAEVDELYLTLT